MKVHELIAQLKDLNPDLPVYVSGYEGGLEDLEIVQEVRVMRDLNDSDKFWWEGPHDTDPKGEPAVVLPRTHRWEAKE